MKFEKTWSAASKSDNLKKSKELVNIAGRWNIGIEVSISKPYEYTQGPIARKKETQENS